MPVTVTWQLKSGAVDFTGRLAGFTVDQQLTLNKQATFKFSLTLRNQDGALTPGGGGTYTTQDWLATLMTLYCTVSDGTTSNQVVVAEGLVQDFRLQDDGVQSQVTMQLVDKWSVGARMRRGSIATFAAQNADTFLNNSLAWSPLNGYWFAGYTPVVTDDSMTHTRQVASQTTLASVTYADLMSSVIYPALNAWGWPDADQVGLFMYSRFVTGNRNWDTASPPDFTFNQAASISGTTLPFKDLQQAFNTPELVNTATFKSLMTGGTEQTTVAANASTYGSRAVQFTRAATTSDAASLNRATELVARYNQSQFFPETLSLTTSEITRLCANAARPVVLNLLRLWQSGGGSYQGPWLRRATVTWTGKGAASQTRRCIILGRRIQATATGDCTITLTLGSWADNHNAWILDYDTLGEDRLG